MKKLLFIVFFPIFLMAQNVPMLTANGIEAVVTDVDSLTAAQLYTKTIDWVHLNYKNPNEVIKANIPNEMLRIDGFQSGFFEMKALGSVYYDISYTVTFSFKDDRYKFEFVVTDRTNKGYQLTFTERNFFKKKDGSVRKMYQLAHNSFNASLEGLYLSHFNYVTGKGSGNDDW